MDAVKDGLANGRVFGAGCNFVAATLLVDDPVAVPPPPPIADVMEELRRRFKEEQERRRFEEERSRALSEELVMVKVSSEELKNKISNVEADIPSCRAASSGEPTLVSRQSPFCGKYHGDRFVGPDG
ncbi:hypothetical protein LIER_25082 [Lithospermum erythrorhizon]|uniref:Uncharacterized protein n=1 Tax=Lithospermum erythrorhizon TaxID=34254 RepID=A0AAV3R7G7_LITER